MTHSTMERYAATPSTSQSLLEQARQHDDVAWVLLVKLYGPLVYAWCRGFGLSPDSAEVVGQEVFFAVFTSLNQFRKVNSTDSFRGWLKRIVRNKAVDYFKSESKQPHAIGGELASAMFHEIPDVDDDELHHDSAERQFLYARAFRMIQAEFNGTDIAAFQQFVGHDRSAKDLCAELGINENQVYIAKHRILKRLREVFKDLLPVVDEGEQSLAV